MGKRGENIHKRKDGRWEARILIYDICGQSKYHSEYGKTYKEAKEKKELYIKRKQPTPKGTLDVTFGEIVELWLANNFFVQKESTKLKYSNIIKAHIIPALGDINITQIDEVLINQFLTNKKECGRVDKKGGLSNSYIKTMAIIINSVINYAVERELCSPLKSKIKKPPVSKNEINILSVENQKKIEIVLQGDDSLTALGIIIALNTGLRIGEICALQWEDIDFKESVMHIRHSIIRVQSKERSNKQKTILILDNPKTKTSIRDIPITSKLYVILLKAKKRASSKFVVSDKAEFVSPRTFEYRFHKILFQYGFPDTNFHTLRHTFATRCVELNVDTKTLSEVLGHSSVGITLNTYVHPSFDIKRSQLEKLSLLYL